jgi:hypothetical protein
MYIEQCYVRLTGSWRVPWYTKSGGNRFLKKPLIRKYGEAWYSELEQIIAEEEKNAATA